MSLLVGPSMIARLSRYQIGQVVRDDGPRSHLPKAGTPTMGGALIIVAIVVSTLLWADLRNRFVWITLGVTRRLRRDRLLRRLSEAGGRQFARPDRRAGNISGSRVLGLGAAVLLYRTAHVPARDRFLRAVRQEQSACRWARSASSRSPIS